MIRHNQSQLVAEFRLPSTLDVDAGLSEAPGQTQTELARAVPGFVVLVVVLGECISRRAIVAILEGHDSRGRQDEPIL